MNRREFLCSLPVASMKIVPPTTLRGRLSRWLPPDGFRPGEFCPACQQELATTLRSQGLRLWFAKDIYPARCFLDGVVVPDVAQLIAAPEPDQPREGAVFQYRREPNGRYRVQGNRVAGTWLFGTVRWGRIVELVE